MSFLYLSLPPVPRFTPLIFHILVPTPHLEDSSLMGGYQSKAVFCVPWEPFCCPLCLFALTLSSYIQKAPFVRRAPVLEDEPSSSLAWEGSTLPCPLQEPQSCLLAFLLASAQMPPLKT